MVHTLHRVLNGSSGQKQPVSALQAKQRLPSRTVRILDVLCFVKNHVLPLHATEMGHILRDLADRLASHLQLQLVDIRVDSW